jgi:hypothetical protein
MTTAKVPTEYLAFDPNNPRLIEDGIKNPTDTDIIMALSDSADLAEVVESVALNGYIDIEPLVAQKIRGRWRVLEGNRRLAAIRILQDPSLAKGTGISPPKASAAVLKTLNEVTVYAVSDPEQAREFIGFKHINGPPQVGGIGEGSICCGLVQERKKDRSYYRQDRAPFG